MKNYYDVLDVPANASADEIKRRHRFLIQAFHPDRFRNQDDKAEAERRASAINEAYDVLGDPVLRAAYDLQRPPQRAEADIRAAAARWQAEQRRGAEEARRHAEARYSRSETERGRQEARWRAEAEQRREEAQRRAGHYRAVNEHEFNRPDYAWKYQQNPYRPAVTAYDILNHPWLGVLLLVEAVIDFARDFERERL